MSTLIDDTEVRVYPDLFEVIHGEVVEKESMSAFAIFLGFRIAYLLNRYADRDFGRACTELLIAMPDRFEHNRRPDVSYFSYQTFPKGTPVPHDDAFPMVPDLCAEVVSPTDLIEMLEEKIGEYFDAGVKRVWVVHPAQKAIEVCLSKTERRMLYSNDVLKGDEIIPGFEVPVADLFQI